MGIMIIQPTFLPKSFKRIEEGDLMDSDYTYLGVNDYLDLYLLAKELGDQSWQNELLEKMQGLRKEAISRQNPETSIHKLWNKYKKINTQMLDLYDQWRNNKFDQDIYKKMKELKQQRMEISRKIYAAERKSPN